MCLRSWFLCAIALVGQAAAFYPYTHPKGVQDDRNTVPAVDGRGLHYGEYSQPRESNRKKSMKLTMKRKARPPTLRSYEPTIHRSGTPVKRDNEFNVVTAATPSQTNSAPIDEDGTDFSYFVPISFGSKGSLMYMLVDTGAANTWVMGSNCTTEACQKHNRFGEEDSSTFKSTGDIFNLTYGTGSVSGTTVNDTVQIAGMSIPLLFGAASTTSVDFLDYPMDGILGLGRSASNIMPFPTVMEAIMSTKILQSNVFGVNLQRESDGSTNGELNFGSPDTARYTGDLSYTDTTSDGKMWEIPIDDAGFNGHLCKFSGKSAVIDTGTTFMLLPPDDSKQLHLQIPQAQQNDEIFYVPCSTKEPIQVVISGVSYNITPADYIGKAVKDGDLCESNIIGRQAFGADQWLLGDVFLKNVYTVFDFDKDRIGFGVKDENPTSTDSASTTITSTRAGPATALASASSATPSALLPEGAASSPSGAAHSQSSTSSGLKPLGTSNSGAKASICMHILAASIVVSVLCSKALA